MLNQLRPPFHQHHHVEVEIHHVNPRIAQFDHVKVQIHQKSKDRPDLILEEENKNKSIKTIGIVHVMMIEVEIVQEKIIIDLEDIEMIVKNMLIPPKKNNQSQNVLLIVEIVVVRDEVGETERKEIEEIPVKDVVDVEVDRPFFF